MPIHLNWKEIEFLTKKLSSEVENVFVDKVIIPERPKFPDGYLKGEWALKLAGKSQEGTLLMSIRPRHPYFAWQSGKGLKGVVTATRSPFDLSLSKHLKGAKLLKCVSIDQERVVVFWFSEEGRSDSRLGLVLVLIPAAPEAFLVSASADEISRGSWKIIARSRTIRDESKVLEFYSPPSGFQAPKDLSIRTEILGDLNSFYQTLERERNQEAFELRNLNADKALRQKMKHAQDRLRQSQTALQEAQAEQDWQNYGDLLKASYGNPPPLVGNTRTVMDYVSEKEIALPCDPKLDLKSQIEKFYQLSKRKQRRIHEARLRMENFDSLLNDLKVWVSKPVESGDWSALEAKEQKAGTSVVSDGKKDSNDRHFHKKSPWLGKTFTSKDGLTIYVGRSKDENLELTFKLARGNDLWMHVRGRPGAHLVIPLQPGKSAPLETLLDAASLVIHYSGGQNWGKTEVDYTYKKYVKRIKDSTEASYINNKTLIVEPDASRLKRLLE